MALVFSDATQNSSGSKHDSSSSAERKHSVHGDLLCLVGAVFYAVSNVSQEAIVKKYDIVSKHAWAGLFLAESMPGFSRRPSCNMRAVPPINFMAPVGCTTIFTSRHRSARGRT